MYKNHNSLLHNLGVIAICYFFILCLQHNAKLYELFMQNFIGRSINEKKCSVQEPFFA